MNTVQPLPLFHSSQSVDSISSLSKPNSSFPATDFVVKPAQNGQPEVRLFDILRAKKPVVLIFYPNETFPYCKKQIAEMKEMLRGTNAELIGVSGMATFLQRFLRAFGRIFSWLNQSASISPDKQPLTLLSDTTGELQKNYHVGTSSWWGIFSTPNRETVVIDPVTFKAHQVYSSPGNEQAGLVHAEKAREILDRLAQTGLDLPKHSSFFR